MFTSSKVPENFTSSCTRVLFIIGQGLSPYFIQVIIGDLLESNVSFSVYFYETTRKQLKKHGSYTEVLLPKT